jgi:cytoskeleton protein RodZ
MTLAAGGETVRGIGARLRAARERKGLTVLQAAEKLHVDPRVLDALEAEDFSALGADVYVRGHLRRYAELAGESPGELQELYAAGGQAPHPDLTQIPHQGGPARSAAVALPALLVVVGLAIAGVIWWAMKLPAEKTRPLVPATAAPAPRPPGMPSERVAPNPAPASAPRTSAAPDAAPVAGGAAAQLDLRFAADSWVEISDADGRHLLHGLVGAGSARELSGTPPLRVVLGNTPAVSVALNGESVSLAGLARRDGSARLLIDSAGHASPAPARLAHGD